jgi:hypothetical protein
LAEASLIDAENLFRQPGPLHFSLDKAMPHVAAAIEAQIDCDDAGDDFVKEKLHSNIHSSSTDSMTWP